MKSIALLSQEDLSKVPANLVMRTGAVATFVDDEGNEFNTYKVSINTYIVLYLLNFDMVSL